MPNIYSYISDCNNSVDIFGLSCTRDLKRNMNDANSDLAKDEGYMMIKWNKISGSAAHHIVAGDHRNHFAQKARDILEKHGIDINGANNGIYLKHIYKNSAQPGAYHRIIHTNVYFENVFNRLEATDMLGEKAGVIDELGRIADDLFNNVKIW